MLLNLHSYYSLRYGTLSIEKLVQGMLENGYDTAVLTDINNSSGVLDFVRATGKAGLNGLAGFEFRNGDNLMYLGIARNEAGFRELNELATRSNRAGGSFPETPPGFENVWVIYPFGSKAVGQLREHEWIGITPAQVGRVVMAAPSELQRYVMLATVSFGREDVLLHSQLRAIDQNLLISQLKREHVANADEFFVPRQQLLARYQQVPQVIRNTERLLEDCSFRFDFRAIKNKAAFTSGRYEDRELLRRLTEERFLNRYSADNVHAVQRVKDELETIDALGFSSYFLMTDDICRFARSRGYYYVGRGSGANSIIAYCLGITNVCPIELGLYFERFLNPKRQSPPDFDIDFSWRDRDEVYHYLFNRYAPGHVGLMGAMSTFRSRSVIRELGKIYGLPKREIDRLIHEPEHMLNKNEVTGLILNVYNRMADFPNQRTIHASGVLISEEPLTSYAALDYPPKGLPTVQFDMYVAEEIGFEKFDILSQRGIGHIRDCRELVLRNRGEEVNIDQPQRFFSDEKVAARLKEADTIGCFYIESPGMRQLLIKLRCDKYLTLVAASSIIRPGVASSGMMRAYIERHLDPGKTNYPHPVFEAHLKETYGVMVYQEDVMKIGHFYGGLDMAEADVLRRMMSGKSRDWKSLREIEKKFFTNCRDKGYDEQVSQEIWRQMESFAGYSFNKAHSASYAVESYQSLYLKTYYPLEFMVAVLNNYGGFYNRKVYINEARKAGGQICLPCVNTSGHNTTIAGDQIYLGLDCLLHFESRLAELVPEERRQNGNYLSLENFVLRTGATLDQVLVLIRCGAFRFSGVGKRELLWEAHLLFSGQRKRNVSASLFENMSVKPVLPQLEADELEDLYDEIEIIGFPVTVSMFSLAKSAYRGEVSARELAEYEGKTLRMVGDFVIDKQVQTRRNQLQKYGTFLDANGDFFDTVHYPASLAGYPLRGNGLYLLEGRVVMDFGQPVLDVIRCAKMPLKPDPRSV
ncbi:hypothetical protein GCM10023091_36030 [Ravibacter arvi]|uniref:DNA-directed DNA polymerase n=1 Tax=Ravibacter arvi TaxID=2051041 RepID=A0ABP8M992_9BACT